MEIDQVSGNKLVWLLLLQLVPAFGARVGFIDMVQVNLVVLGRGLNFLPFFF